MPTPIVLPKTYDNFAAMRSLADPANHQKRLTGGITKSETGFQIEDKMLSLYVDVKAKGKPIVSAWHKLTGTRARQVQASRAAIKNVLVSVKRMERALEKEADRASLDQAIQDVESLLKRHAPGGARSSSLIKMSELQPHFRTILDIHEVHSADAAERSKQAEARIADRLPKIDERVNSAREPSRLGLEDTCDRFVEKIDPPAGQKSVLDNLYASFDLHVADESERGTLQAKLASNVRVVVPDANADDGVSDFLQAQLDARTHGNALELALGAKGSMRMEQFSEMTNSYFAPLAHGIPESIRSQLNSVSTILGYYNLGRPLGMTVDNFLKRIDENPSMAGYAAGELVKSIPHIINQLHYAQEMLTNPKFLNTMTPDVREPLRNYGESLQAKLFTMTNPTGPVMVAFRMAQAVLDDPAAAIGALQARRGVVGSA